MKMESYNPATGEVVARYNALEAKEVEKAIRAAQTAYIGWRKLRFEERAPFFIRLADRLFEQKAELGRLAALEMGKPIRQAMSEVEKCAGVCRYYAEKSAVILNNEMVDTDAHESFVRFDPLGIILAVMPWNFPFWQVLRFAAPSLMAGNVALLKHASNVPGCASAIDRLFREAGFPDGVFRALLIDAGTAARLAEDSRIKAVTLTGSEGAGRSLGEASGKGLKPIVLELGGSDPFIVLNDADLDLCLSIAVPARIQNNGQSCIAAKRFILVESIAERFTVGLIQALKKLKTGDPMDETTDLGPLARPDLAVELERQVRKSIADGARIIWRDGEYKKESAFYPVTVLDDVKPGMPAYEEELFGPVFSLIRAADENEAVRIANDTHFGLGASLWTTDREKGKRIAADIDAGMVFINAMVRSDPRLPFGGVKLSGFGRELSHFGIREFVNIKTVWVD